MPYTSYDPDTSVIPTPSRVREVDRELEKLSKLVANIYGASEELSKRLTIVCRPFGRIDQNAVKDESPTVQLATLVHEQSKKLEQTLETLQGLLNGLEL